MKCPFCQSKTRIYNSRSSHQATQTWRRRQCLYCKKAFTTREKVDFNGVVTVRSLHDSEAPYNRERLLLSLAHAGDKLNLAPETVVELTDSIELALKDKQFFARSPQEAKTIVSIATTILLRYNTNLALQYVNLVYSNKPPLELIRQITQDQN